MIFLSNLEYSQHVLNETQTFNQSRILKTDFLDSSR